MKRLTIIKDDSLVGVDGVFFKVDCSKLPQNFHALQWNAEESLGEIEWAGKPRPPNSTITSISEYASYVNEWRKMKLAQDALIASNG